VRKFLLLFPLVAISAKPPARFVAHTVATDLKGGYQVVPVDLNHDGRPDLLVVASGLSELLWFENPSWERHVIAGGFHAMINAAALDTDGDGIPEIILASEFSNDAARSGGRVSLLHQNGDPRQPWSVTDIDHLPTSHRLRWASPEGRGGRVLVNAPLTGAGTVPPDYRGHTPLVFYSPGDWARHLIGDQNEGVVHGIWIVDWDANGRDAILTASFQGIHLYRYTDRWTRTEIARGDPSPCPKCGSSDVSVGKIGQSRFVAAIEPWHGNQVSVYQQQGAVWGRQVIDDSLVDGHTILTADLNRDGRDEIVAGFRGTGRSVNVYYAESEDATAWTKRVLDEGGMAAASCAASDLNADRRIDIVCIGSATENLKWYENAGAGK
jgi:hypothetical protein